MSKKQSSVDWLFSQLWETPKDKYTWFGLLMKAKEKHEQEVIDSRLSVVRENSDVGISETTLKAERELAKQYYNENFD